MPFGNPCGDKRFHEGLRDEVPDAGELYCALFASPRVRKALRSANANDPNCRRNASELTHGRRSKTRLKATCLQNVAHRV
eukprot:4561559-Pyramimonas_sp.AAC.1